jgi:hypothetical protein
MSPEASGPETAGTSPGTAHAMVTVEQVRGALERVMDPELKRNLVESAWTRSFRVACPLTPKSPGFATQGRLNPTRRWRVVEEAA